MSKFFNDAMVSGSCLFTDVIVKDGVEIFKGIKSLVDVTDGTGTISKVIADNFFHVKCIIFELPHLASDFPNNEKVKFVTDDMFEYISPTVLFS
jgi:trans-resveratrol di-O-methyltransferase